jgi:preprotein translocase subunit SecE
MDVSSAVIGGISALLINDHLTKKEAAGFAAAKAFITRLEKDDPARYAAICKTVEEMHADNPRKIIKYLNKLENETRKPTFSKRTENIATVIGFSIALFLVISIVIAWLSL